uniref:Retinol dehydrogenase 13-like n=1 Tax=Phallusia mammillata TaxID=59560 RepID=A0A6F9DRH6_9ASCI|nr:retinol dehydrogenase 13-like [Phallusia mammillata]
MSFINSPVFNRVIVPISFTASLFGGVFLLREYTGGRKCPSNDRMDGKVVLITGANTGIGKETAKEIAKRGAVVILGCRHMGKCAATAVEIRNVSQNKNVKCHFIDLANLDSVTEFVKEIKNEQQHIDVLVNNAGVMKPRSPKTTPNTDDGFERQFGVNHLGHFLLTNLLLDQLTNGESPGRVINVTSDAYQKGKVDIDDIEKNELKGDNRLTELYYQSKLANVLFTKVLSDRSRENLKKRVTCNCVNPGVAHTGIGRHANVPFYSVGVHMFKPLTWMAMRTPRQAAQTSIYLACDSALANVTGAYFDDCKKVEDTKDMCDGVVAEKLWKASEEWTNLNQRMSQLRETAKSGAPQNIGPACNNSTTS